MNFKKVSCLLCFAPFALCQLALSQEIVNASWRSISTLNSVNSGFPATGSNDLGILVWGGSDRYSSSGWTGATNEGAFYSALSGMWTSTATTGAPAGRILPLLTPITKGFFVWGGQNVNGQRVNEGAIYYPYKNTWTHCSSSPLPLRAPSMSVWTGNEVLIWHGGGTGERVGAAYNPSTDTWRSISNVNCPASLGNFFHCWTPYGWFVSGGDDQGTFLYSSISDVWTPILSGSLTYPSNTSGYLPNRGNAVWTGKEVVVISEGTIRNGDMVTSGNNGVAYNPVSNMWRQINVRGLPRFNCIIWSGAEIYCLPAASSQIYAYCPTKDSWRALAPTAYNTSYPLPTTAWFGDELLIYQHGAQMIAYTPRYDR